MIEGLVTTIIILITMYFKHDGINASIGSKYSHLIDNSTHNQQQQLEQLIKNIQDTKSNHHKIQLQIIKRQKYNARLMKMIKENNDLISTRNAQIVNSYNKITQYDTDMKQLEIDISNLYLKTMKENENFIKNIYSDHLSSIIQ